MSRPRLSSAVLLLLAAILAACGGAPQSVAPTTAPADQATQAPAAPATSAPAAQTPATAASGGTLRIGRTAAPDSLNPGAGYLSEAFDIYNLVYDSLIFTDLRNQPQPQLAKEFSVAADGKTWTFKLHEGAMWHDGKPVTSEDVAFTYNMIRSFEAFALLKDYTTLIEKIETPDPATVVIVFEGPVANTDERFSAVPILPKHIWEQFKDEQSAVEFENLEMIGSGPFMMEEFKPGEFTRLKANKDHYLTPPKIDEVIFRVFGNDDAMVQALKTGEVELIEPQNTVVRALQSESNVKIEIGNDLRLVDIIFDVTEPENCPPDDGKCTGHPALRDVKVRQALAYAVDKQQLIDVVQLGLAAPGLSLVLPGHGDAFHKGLPDYAYDPEKAKQLLEDAGYKDSDGDGVREMPGDPSQPLRLRYSYPSDQYAAEGPRFAELLGEMWMQVGVAIDIQAIEADALTAACCPAFDYDIIQWGWSAGPDPSSLLSVLTTDNITTGVGESGYSNPEYDQLYQEQQVTADRQKRIELFHKMQEILVRDVPYIIPYYPQKLEAYRSDRFQGWVIDPEGLQTLSSRISLVVITPMQ